MSRRRRQAGSGRQAVEGLVQQHQAPSRTAPVRSSRPRRSSARCRRGATGEVRQQGAAYLNDGAAGCPPYRGADASRAPPLPGSPWRRARRRRRRSADAGAAGASGWCRCRSRRSRCGGSRRAGTCPRCRSDGSIPVHVAQCLGMDWQDRDLARRSMILTAEKVRPLVESGAGNGAVTGVGMTTTKRRTLLADGLREELAQNGALSVARVMRTPPARRASTPSASPASGIATPIRRGPSSPPRSRTGARWCSSSASRSKPCR
jgi:hypothetical protein